MSSIESLPPDQSGKLVALEGDVDTVATQLQLLPPSQKILVLPSLLDDFPQNDDTPTFNARAFIQGAHAAFVGRIERARSFLQSSTIPQPRLVFMNGGSVRARAECITRISKNLTNGEVGEAEIIFNEIVKDGVVGLMKYEGVAEEAEERNENDQKDEGNGDTQETPESVEDPTFKAMKAADCLDRDTAELQQDSAEEHTVGIPENSTGVVLEAEAGVPEGKKDALKTERGDDIIRTIVTLPIKAERTREKRSTNSPQYPASSTTPLPSTTQYTVAPSQQIEDDDDYAYDDDYAPDLVSPGDSSFFPAPKAAVVYGEACVVDLQGTFPIKPSRKVRSVESFHPSKSEFEDWDSNPSGLLKHAKSANHLSQPGFPGGWLQEDQSYDNFQTLPRTTFLRASTTTIKKPSISSDSMTSSVSTPKARVYVERGTDAEDIPIEKMTHDGAPFEPVFPLVEDLVIHFAHDDLNDVFEYVLSAYKNGTYPVLPSLEKEFSLVPASPSKTNAEERPISHLTTESDDDCYRRNEFDPYAANNYPAGVNQWPMKHRNERRAGRNLKPPSPTLTPPPSARGIPNKFSAFSPLNPNSVIGIQNSLRSLLNIHFPAGENKYSQYYFQVSPKAERLWKPVFRNDETSSIGNEGRTVDQIIAFGCEDGVKKDFFYQISGQVEKLGMKRDGLNRSAKLDLGYLIANVMQTHSNLPSQIQSKFDRMSDAQVLATCIVPQIEAYLAINTSTRLLILHYSFDQLAIIIALRKILGEGILKIAGIVDSMSSDPPSLVKHKSNPLSNEATSKRSSPAVSRISQRQSPTNSSISSMNSQSQNSEVSFSKANYLLPSIATDAEIATFLSGIWMSLMEHSTFYTPESDPKPTIIEKPPLPPTPVTSTFGSRDPSQPPISYRQGPMSRETKITRLTGNSGVNSTPPRTPTGGKGHKYAASIASTVRTTNSERVRREDARVEKEWENFYIGEEDSEDDDIDRMVLGRSLARIVPEAKVVTSDGRVPKRSTKKALKWLGLA